MSISLSYDDTLSRVQIGLSGLSVDAVRVERSTNQLYWETVRGGLAMPVHDGQVDLDDYEFAADVTNHYRVLDVENLEGPPVESDDIAPSLDDKVWLKSIRYPLLNRTIDVGNWGEISRRSRTGIFDVAGRSYPVSTHDLRGSRQFTLTVWTDDMREDDTTDPSVDARKLDLILALSDVMFIHVPADSPVPGGYVAIEDVAEDRIVRAGNVPREFNLACVEVAPPSPLVVGTTLTWGTVWAQYASWTQLWAANPSWRDLLATVGSPEDLVVL